MSEEPKSIWKKSWKSSGLWILFVAALAILIALIVLLIVDHGRIGQDADIFEIVAGFCFVGALVALFIRWVFNWKNFRRFLFGCACLITLVALFYAEEDWRGKHDWEKFKRQQEAKGEKFDFAGIVPPAVPEDQNFAFSPVWIAEIKADFLSTPERAELWYGDRIFSPAVSNAIPEMASVEGWSGTNIWNHSYSSVLEVPAIPSGWLDAEITDLKPWQVYYRQFAKMVPAAGIPIASQPQTPAQDVLLALSKFDPVIEQLRRDSARPYSRFPIVYDADQPFDILLPHLAAVKRYELILQLRAISELQNGESGKALADVKLMLRLADSVKAEPFLISHLVRIAVLQITMQPVYEGLAGHQWSDGQLVELDSELAKFNLLADYEYSMRGERNASISAVEGMRRNREIITFDSNFSVKRTKIAWIIPRAFFIQNELTIARMHQLYTLPAVDEEKQLAIPSHIDRLNVEADRELSHHFWPNKIFARMLFPSLENAARKFVYSQELIDLARTAIGLERYRLAHGNYPESLDALPSQFMPQIPHDIIDGQPLHYRRTGDGQFVLYSIGWNETDDGGVVVNYPRSTDRVDIVKGDWVWRYPQK
ncbi:MAG TPA: hypothetical protein VFV23_04360 [Verrucomicrobiae bacterium]|nr:hypothetical protein [Verrucomicrobiae bacterium]